MRKLRLGKILRTYPLLHWYEVQRWDSDQASVSKACACLRRYVLFTEHYLPRLQNILEMLGIIICTNLDNKIILLYLITWKHVIDEW